MNVATAAPTTSPASAEPVMVTGFKALVDSTAVRKLDLSREDNLLGRLCECCGSLMYQHTDGPKRIRSPLVGYIAPGSEWDKYRTYDGSNEDFERMWTEMMNDKEHLAAYLKAHPGQVHHPIQFEYWSVYYGRLGHGPETATKAWNDWKRSIRNLAPSPETYRNRSQIIADNRPVEEALSYWFGSFDPKVREGYSIDDPDLGHVSILWVNQ